MIEVTTERTSYPDVVCQACTPPSAKNTFVYVVAAGPPGRDVGAIVHTTVLKLCAVCMQELVAGARTAERQPVGRRWATAR